MDEDEEIKEYERLVEKESKDKNFMKVKEISIAENLTQMSLNEATRANAGNPAFGQMLSKNSPGWAKTLFKGLLAYILAAMAIFIIGIALLSLTGRL